MPSRIRQWINTFKFKKRKIFYRTEGKINFQISKSCINSLHAGLHYKTYSRKFLQDEENQYQIKKFRFAQKNRVAKWKRFLVLSFKSFKR